MKPIYKKCGNCKNFDILNVRSDDKANCNVVNAMVDKYRSAERCPFYNLNYYLCGASLAAALTKISNEFNEIKKAVERCSKKILEVFGERYKAIQAYPNKRIVELALHSKKARVRKKNMNKIMNWYCKKEEDEK